MTNAEIGLGSEKYSGITNEEIGLGSPQYSGIDINKAIMVSGRNQFSRAAADDCCDTWCSGWCECDNSCKDEETSVMQLQTLKRTARLVSTPKRSLSGVKLSARNISRFSHAERCRTVCSGCKRMCTDKSHGCCEQNCTTICDPISTPMLSIKQFRYRGGYRKPKTISRFSHVTVAGIESQCGSQNLPAPPLVATQAQQADYDACVKQQKRQRFFDLIYTIPDFFRGDRDGAVTNGNAGNGDDDDKPTTPWGLIIGIPVAILVLFLGYKALTAKGKVKVK